MQISGISPFDQRDGACILLLKIIFMGMPAVQFERGGKVQVQFEIAPAPVATLRKNITMIKEKFGNYNILTKPRKDFTKLRKSYRRGLYGVMGEICEKAAILEGDEGKYKQFADDGYWDTSPERPQLKRRRNKRSLIFFGVDFVMRLKDAKVAHKRVRVLEFLTKVEEVPPGDIAAEIERLGGIEKVHQLAVKEDPRRAVRQSKATADDVEEMSEDFGSDMDHWEEPANASSGGKTLLVEADAGIMQRLEEIGERDVWVKIRDLGADLRFRALKVKPTTKSD